jgi:hypothetical protein
VSRVCCCVPFCRRTTGKLPEGFEWICPTHWRTIPQKRRRAYRRVWRLWHGGAEHVGMTIAEILAHPKWGKRAIHRAAADRLWARVKREAIERALVGSPSCEDRGNLGASQRLGRGAS